MNAMYTTSSYGMGKDQMSYKLHSGEEGLLIIDDNQHGLNGKSLHVLLSRKTDLSNRSSVNLKSKLLNPITGTNQHDTAKNYEKSSIDYSLDEIEKSQIDNTDARTVSHDNKSEMDMQLNKQHISSAVIVNLTKQNEKKKIDSEFVLENNS